MSRTSIPLALCVVEILKKHSDKIHTLTKQKIMDLLRDEYQITAKPTTVKNTLERLRDFGYDIHCRSTRRSNGTVACTSYYIEPALTADEYCALIDALVFSDRITDEQYVRLAATLTGMAGTGFSEYTWHIHRERRDRTDCTYLYRKLRLLDEAIRTGSEITFSLRSASPSTDQPALPKPVFHITPTRIDACEDGSYYLCADEGGYRISVSSMEDPSIQMEDDTKPEGSTRQSTSEAAPSGVEAGSDDFGTEPDASEAAPDESEAEPDYNEVAPDEPEAGFDSYEIAPDNPEAEPEEAGAESDDFEAEPDYNEDGPDESEAEPGYDVAENTPPEVCDSANSSATVLPSPEDGSRGWVDGTDGKADDTAVSAEDSLDNLDDETSAPDLMDVGNVMDEPSRTDKSADDVPAADTINKETALADMVSPTKTTSEDGSTGTPVTRDEAPSQADSESFDSAIRKAFDGEDGTDSDVKCEQLDFFSLFDHSEDISEP